MLKADRQSMANVWRSERGGAKVKAAENYIWALREEDMKFFLVSMFT